MERIFFDIGGSDGSSVRFFREHHPQADEFTIISFEPIQSNIDALVDIRPPVVVLPSAAWVYDGTVPMFTGKPKSGSMYSDKTTGNVSPENRIDVPCIDLARYIKGAFNPKDELWLKMNVEGAEYELVPHLHKNGLIPWFNKLFIRWHAPKIPSLQKVHDDVVKLVPNAQNIWRKESVIPILAEVG